MLNFSFRTFDTFIIIIKGRHFHEIYATPIYVHSSYRKKERWHIWREIFIIHEKLNKKNVFLDPVASYRILRYTIFQQDFSTDSLLHYASVSNHCILRFLIVIILILFS